jgi:hypothetical protein
MSIVLSSNLTLENPPREYRYGRNFAPRDPTIGCQKLELTILMCGLVRIPFDGPAKSLTFSLSSMSWKSAQCCLHNLQQPPARNILSRHPHAFQSYSKTIAKVSCINSPIKKNCPTTRRRRVVPEHRANSTEICAAREKREFLTEVRSLQVMAPVTRCVLPPPGDEGR